MKEYFSSERKIGDLKPNMRPLERLELLEVTPNQTVVGAKLDGEFTLLSYNRERESYVLNKWGHIRQDFPALNQFVEAMNKTEVTHAELLCELYAKEDGKPTNLPTFMRYIKGKDKDINKIHIGIWDLIKIDGNPPPNDFAWKLEEVERWVKGCTHVAVVPYIKPQTIQDIKDFWRACVEEKGYEGLVIRNGDQIFKIKPSLDVDAVIIGLNKESNYGRNLSHFQQKEITSIKLALMQPDETFIELSDCASGITEELRTALWKLMDYKVSEDDKTVYVKPIVVCTIQYTDTYQKERQVLKFDGEKYTEAGTKPFVSLRHPRLIRFRPDKAVNPQDLRTTQIPEGKPLQFILYQGDCRQVLPLIHSESIDLIITSPPYWKVKEYSSVEEEIGTKGSPDQYKADLLEVFNECYRVLKPSGVFCLNLDRGREVTAWEFIPHLKTMGFHLTDTIIWYDKSRRREMTYLSHSYEPIFILTKNQNFTFNKFSPHQNDVWEITHYKGVSMEKGDLWDRMGIATFPVQLVKELMNLYSNPNDTVLDPFAGSGTVLDVAQRLGRNSIAIEISWDYCQTIINRCFDKHPLHKYFFQKQNSHPIL
jgi:DNA modification methylase